MSLILDALRKGQKGGQASSSGAHERPLFFSQVPPFLSHRRRWMVSLVSIGVGFMAGVGVALSLLGWGAIRGLLVETSLTNPREMSSFVLGISALVVQGGTILCLMLLWLLHQKEFLHEVFLTLHSLEARNQQAQRDLFLILRSYLGFHEVPVHGPVAGADFRVASGAARYEESKAREKAKGLSPDEIQLLVTLSTGGSKSLAKIRKGDESADNLESRLCSLRDKGFIFYSEYSDRVAILPKAHSYIYSYIATLNRERHSGSA